MTSRSATVPGGGRGGYPVCGGFALISMYDRLEPIPMVEGVRGDCLPSVRCWSRGGMPGFWGLTAILISAGTARRQLSVNASNSSVASLTRPGTGIVTSSNLPLPYRSQILSPEDQRRRPAKYRPRPARMDLGDDCLRQSKCHPESPEENSPDKERCVSSSELGRYPYPE